MPQKRVSKSGRSYWVGRYRDINGRERSKSFSLRREAAAWEEEQSRAVRRGEWIDPTWEKTTVKALMEQWARRPIRESTRAYYEATIRDLGPLADIPARRLTRADADSWHHQLVTGRPWVSASDTGLAATTARERMVQLASALNYGVEVGILVRNPVRVPRAVVGEQAVRRSELPTPEMIAKIIELARDGGAIYSTYRGVQRMQPSRIFAAMVQTAVGTGLRVSELCGLVVGDVDFLRREVRVELQASRDGRERVPLKSASSQRVVPVSDELLVVLDGMVRGRRRGDPLFVTSRGGMWNASAAARSLRQIVEHLGYQLTFHSFRHYYASVLIDAGVSVAGVQRLLGHHSATVTLSVYTHLLPTADDQARRAIAGIAVGCGENAGFSADSVGGNAVDLG